MRSNLRLNSLAGIILREVSLVKSLHQISEIAVNGAIDIGRLERLRTREADAGIAQTQTVEPVSATRRASAEPLDYSTARRLDCARRSRRDRCDETVSQVGEIVLGVVQAFRSGGIDDESISIVTRDSATSQLCREALSQHGESAVQFVVHDPDDERRVMPSGDDQAEWTAGGESRHL